MLSNYRPVLLIVVGLLALTIGFQNCENVKFNSTSLPSDDGDGGAQNSPDDANNPDPITFQIEFEPTADPLPNEFLFVLDDSCSMGNVLQEVRMGFASIESVEYPEMTKMAVTYMSPAWVDDNGLADFAKPYHGSTRSQVLASPGFLDLVNQYTINNYLQQFDDQKNFPLQGCSEAWFEPRAVNSQGEQCLEAAIQAPLLCTSVEAGITTLQQLVLRAGSEPLFRDNALVNVIMVSDTHDAGANYYGRSGALASRPKLAEIKSLIMQNSKIHDLKISAIAPLPKEGDDRLKGLKVVGQVPSKTEKIGGEGLHDHSYLPYVRETGGVALHVRNQDWKEAISELVEFVGQTQQGVFNLPQKAESLVEVSIDGQKIDSNEYRLEGNGNKLVLLNPLPVGHKYDIKIVFISAD